MWQNVLAVITTVPAIAWFVNAFVNLWKMYNKNEEKIMKVAKETTEKVQSGAKEGANKLTETVKKMEEKVEEKLYNGDPKKDSNDDTKSTAAGGGK